MAENTGLQNLDLDHLDRPDLGVGPTGRYSEESNKPRNVYRTMIRETLAAIGKSKHVKITLGWFEDAQKKWPDINQGLNDRKPGSLVAAWALIKEMNPQYISFLIQRAESVIAGHEKRLPNSASKFQYARKELEKAKNEELPIEKRVRSAVQARKQANFIAFKETEAIRNFEVNEREKRRTLYSDGNGRNGHNRSLQEAMDDAGVTKTPVKSKTSRKAAPKKSKVKA